MKSETAGGEPAGSRLRSGRTTASRTAATATPIRSRVGMAPSRREEARRPALEEQDDADEDRDLAGHGAPRRPASPAPKAKVAASTTPARTPRHELIARFCVTARMRRPALVRKSSQ